MTVKTLNSEIFIIIFLYRSILQKVGVVLLPPSAATELEAETDPLYSAVMTSVSPRCLSFSLNGKGHVN